VTDDRSTKHEPDSFADLANQPTGSGVADEQTAFDHATDDVNDRADPVPTQEGPEIDESEAQPS
jgi:hypothetical protein